MPKCSDCKKLDVEETWQERLASLIVRHFFPNTLKDEKNESRLRGFAEGYESSGKHGQELKQMQYQIDRLAFEIQQLTLQVVKNNLPNV